MAAKPLIWIASRFDDKARLEVVEVLQSLGAEVVRPDFAEVGKSIAASVSSTLGQCSGFIAIISERIISRHTLWEIERANTAGIPIAFVVSDEASSNFIDESKNSVFRVGSALRSSIQDWLRGLPAKRHVAPTSETDRAKGYAFISYCAEDSAFKLDVVSFLRDNGYAYWDYDDGERDYGAMTFLEMEARIQESALTLSVVSEHWKRSTWCIKEYLYSKEVQKPTFALRASVMEPSLVLAGETFIDFVADRERGFRKLTGELRRKGL